MIKESKKVTREDLLSLEEYSAKRKELRKNLIEFKKNRRVQIGPYATLYFECFETMLAQIQEMLYIEKGGETQIKDELLAYNPLIPKGKELVGTLMFEIDNPLSRSEFLNKVGGIEKKVFIKINNDKIPSLPEKDVDRTSSEGKASAVQFVHFNFSDEQITKFKDFENDIFLNIDHDLYKHTTKFSEKVKKALVRDFN